MYLNEIRLWNFRKFGVDTDDLDDHKPAVVIMLNPGLNVLIGENDSGKTTFVDAIRHLLGTQSREWFRLEETDFNGSGDDRSRKLRIEGVFRGFSDQEAAPFLEWIGFEGQEGQQEYVLIARFSAERKANRIVHYWRAGPDPIGTQMDPEARELLRGTYLKPLRDAENELTPGQRSRLAQIFSAHALFRKPTSEAASNEHELEKIFGRANDEIREYFSLTNKEAEGYKVMQTVNSLLEEFFPQGDSPESTVDISGGELSDILKRLMLTISENPAGLGSLNLLYIAAELLLLQDADYHGLRLGIIEELEAHLHPQAQLRLISLLQKKATKEKWGQFILTTHSTTLGASIDLRNLIICKGFEAFPMAATYTELSQKNYDYLGRFLDATKANLFFARGVILVEGDAENLLIPTLAEIIGRPLHRYGVSIVNVGSIAFLHYANVFQRKDGKGMGIRVAVVTDKDMKPIEWEEENGKTTTPADREAKEKLKGEWADNLTKGGTKCFMSPNWTLEYEIALSRFKKQFYKAVLIADKISNSVTGEPKEEKYTEVEEQAEANYSKWGTDLRDDPRSEQKIAYEIYKKTMIDKEISKAIVAQVFAEMLSDSPQNMIREDLLDSEQLRYLVDAICHVTEPLP
jgi:putative ATP-dependent endonuclease of OLD family